MSSERGAPERRLHPLSFLFLLGEHLKTLLLPLLVLVFTGRRNDNELYALVGVAGVAIYSIAQYFTYRYRIEGDAIVVRSGVLQRNLRHVPFARIQNVALHQNLLHRLFGVAELSLESAGSAKPEAHMRVLRLDDARELERQVRRGGPRAPSVAAAGAAGEAVAPASADERVLLSLSTAEVLRLGLASNRGMLIVGGAFAALAQTGDNLIGRGFASTGRWLGGHADALQLSTVSWLGAVLLLAIVALLGLRLLSTIWALLQFHGFRLSEAEGRLSMQRGLFTRVRATVPRHRIQAWSLHEGLVQRWLGRRSLRVDSPVVEAGHGEKHALKDLAPIATPARIDVLINGLLPRHGWPLHEWQALHPRAWRRKFTVPALLLVLLTAVAAWWRGALALWLLALLPLLAVRGWWWARNAAWAMADGLVAFRGGWLSRYWRFAEVRKLQALELVQSPFDRRLGMATLRFDTAGADGSEPALAIPYLPEATARALYDELSGIIRSEIINRPAGQGN
jgi:putative membrane protein